MYDHHYALRVLVLTSCVLVAPVSAQQAITLSGEGCTGCVVQVERGVTIGDVDGPGVIGPHLTVGRRAGGDYLVSYFASSGEIMLFNADGRYVQTIGRTGEGPGEYRAVRHLVPYRDSVLVFDNALRRVTVLTPDLSAARTFPFRPDPLDVAILGELIGVNAVVPSSEKIGYPLHIFNREGEERASIGYDGGALRMDEPAFGERQIAAGGDRSIWTASPLDYRLEQWSLDGKRLKTFVRDAQFFQPGGSPLPSPDVPPSSKVSDITLDTLGHLWILVAVPDDDWREGITRSDIPEGTGYQISDSNTYYDTVLEVIDPATGSVMASHRLDEHALGFLGPNEFYSYSESDGGHPKVTTWRVALNTLTQRREQ